MRISDRNALLGALIDLAGSSGFAGPHATSDEETAARERAVDRVMAMDHPNWGNDWGAWLAAIPEVEFYELGADER